MITSNELDLKQWDDVINVLVKVAEIVNSTYINVVENTARKRPISVLDLGNVNFSIAIDTILEKYKSYPF